MKSADLQSRSAVHVLLLLLGRGSWGGRERTTFMRYFDSLYFHRRRSSRVRVSCQNIRHSYWELLWEEEETPL